MHIKKQWGVIGSYTSNIDILSILSGTSGGGSLVNQVGLFSWKENIFMVKN